MPNNPLPYQATPQGSLGLLALGYRGLEHWRKARQLPDFAHQPQPKNNTGRKKFLLIGWDAADWKIIQPLLDAGKLPALKKLMQGGAHGHIATLDPPLSPMLWTSIATGHTADKHGILGFIEPDADTGKLRPVQVTSRNVKAVWNILQQEGKKCHVVGWWPSHPAEPIDGVYVSNFYSKVSAAYSEAWPMAGGTIHPEKLSAHFEHLRVHPGELTSAHLFPFVPEFQKVDQEKDHSLAHIAGLLAAGASYHNAATWIMEHEEWDFLAVYYNEIDVFSHHFMKYHPPQQHFVSDESFTLYKHVMEAAYCWHDMMLERMLELADSNTTIMLLSDHGFHSGQSRLEKLPVDPVAPAHEHAPFGVCVLSGKGIRPDNTLFGASLLDVAPTILQSFGIPAGKDMTGKIMAQAFEQYEPIARIDSWEHVAGTSGQHTGAVVTDPWAAQLAMQQLAELGYIETPDDEDLQKIKNTVQESKFFLSRVFMSTDRYEEALPLLVEIHTDSPKTMRYAYRLLNVYLKLKRNSEARAIFNHISTLHPDPAMLPHIHFLEAQLLLAENREDEAFAKFNSLEESAPSLKGLQMQIGRMYIRNKQWEKAKQAYIRSLASDHESPEAHLGLGIAALQLKDYDLALDEMLQAIELRYFFPAAHFHLGETLLQMQAFDHATDAFRVVVDQQPGNRQAHVRLIELYTQAGSMEAAETHRDFLNEYSRGTIYIVSGLPRSGTSMLMQMLQAGGMPIQHDSLREDDINNPKGYFEDDRVKRLQQDHSWLEEADGKVLKVVAPLLRFLPPRFAYKIVFIRRNMHEVLTSQQKMLGRDEKTFPMGIADAFQKQVARAEEWINTSAHAEVLYLEHADVISNPAASAVQIAAFFGTPLAVDKMSAAVDANLYRNRIK
jgi:predicted AlkP superfamily phosphohydrolase/phosphomutase/tetratricopeptide (TPR) repeat protein